MSYFKKYLMYNNTMRTVRYTSHHSKPMGSVIYGKIYQFGGHTNKPVKKGVTLKTTYWAAVIV